MAFNDLREFIQAVEQKGWLARVKAPVDPVLEITEITDRLSKTTTHPAGPGPAHTCGAGGPALLFESVQGSTMPVAINLFGTKQRMELALGVASLDDIARRIDELLEIPKPSGLLEKLALLPKLAELAKFPPKLVSRAPCQDVVHLLEKGTLAQASLFSLPILQCWPQDAGRFITLGATITRNQQTGRRNVGLYREQVFDERTLGMHWQPHKDGAEHWRGYATGERMPVAIALGGDPATMYVASAPLPEGIDEYLFAGFLRKQPVELVKAKTVDLEVPAHAEIVIEGTVEVGPRREEGPFGDHTGYYSLPEPYPVLHVIAITHRKDPIYPTTIVGVPPQEDLWLGKATERIFLPLVRKMVPELVDMNFPAEGIFNNAVIVSIKKSYPGQARKAAHALWGLGQLMFTKVIVVVDADVDVHNLSQVAWLAFMNIDPQRDCFFVQGPVDTLNHASPEWNYGSKMGVDATRKLKEEGHPRPWPDPIVMSDEVKALVTRRWAEYGLG